MRGIFVDVGRVSIARGIKNQSIFLAWGTGGDDWTDDNVPPETYEATGLVHEIGRKKVDRVLYVTRNDTDGEFVLPSGSRWSASTEPTPDIFVDFDYDFTDGGSAIIREVGIYVGCVPNASQPPDKTYFATTDFDDLGTLLMIEHLAAPHHLSPYNRGKYQTVLNF